MNLAQSFKIAWQAVKDNRLRSILTTLGVIIGIASLILLVTMGSSLQVSLVGTFGGQATRTINLLTMPEQPGGGGMGMFSQAVFTERDIAELEAIEGVESIVPHGTVPVSAISHAERTVAHSSLTVTTLESEELEALAEGRLFTPGQPEAILSASAAQLFPEGLTPGNDILVRLLTGEEISVTVVGILEAQQADFAGGFPQGAAIYVPIDPFYTSTVRSPATSEEQRVYPRLTITATTVELVTDVQAQVDTYLRAASDANELRSANQDFFLQTNEQILEQVNDILGTLTGFVTGIALISPVVGSIGIANIMLVSVTERTREIGIMKAIGGQSSTILTLFLIEAMILGLIGAVIGTLLGMLGGFITTQALGLTLAFPLAWIAAAVVAGLVVGIVAGLWPASRASGLDPIEALRYE